MGRANLVPAWLRRALEAALGAALLAVVALIGTGVSRLGEPTVLPDGVAGAALLAPAILSLAVVTAAYPVALGATRGDALLGAVAAFIVGADATLVLAGGPVLLGPDVQPIPAGGLAALAALPAALAGLAAGQLATPLGFGRRAGAWAAIVSALAGLGVLAAIAALT